MAGMAVNDCKMLEKADKGCKWLYMAVMIGNGWK